MPLGYDVASRKLVPNESEADLVRSIFNRLIRLGSTTLLCKELNEQGFRTKRRRGRDGRMNDGLPFNKTTLCKILNNRIYLGEIRHKDKWYPGEHQAVIDQDRWDKATPSWPRTGHRALGIPPGKLRPRSRGCSTAPTARR